LFSGRRELCSGFETDWEIEFPGTGNPSGLRPLADVLITFNMNARYSQLLANKIAAEPSSPVSRLILVAAIIGGPTGSSHVA
jgi:hypothetical protein